MTFTVHTAYIFGPNRQRENGSTFWTKSWITIKYRHLSTYKASTSIILSFHIQDS